MSPAADEPRAPTGSGSPWAPTQIFTRTAIGAGNAMAVGTPVGEFEIVRLLGEGGFGIVYLAQDRMLQRRVALKEYMPATLAERGSGQTVVVTDERHRPVFDAGLAGFLNEARLLAHFDHPSLVKVHRFWQANGTAYMVMPYYEGITLKATLTGMGRRPDERWLMSMLAPLTEALAVLHGENCLHRDIAPDNILLLADSGRPLLLDFGAARQVIGDATQALTAILKPGYAPIEQYAEVPGLKQGPWTDVYALCAVVYAAITGGKPPAAVARMVADHFVPLARCAAGRYSPAFLQAIDDGLRVLPAERIASIAQLRGAIGIDSAAGSTVRPQPDIAPETAPAAAPQRPPVASSLIRRCLPWIGLLLVAALGAGAAWFAVGWAH